LSSRGRADPRDLGRPPRQRYRFRRPFIAYLSSLTNVNYSATQYALFSSMMLLLPKFLAGYSGSYVDAFGYSNFFTATALLGVPVLLVWLASKQKPPPSE